MIEQEEEICQMRCSFLCNSTIFEPFLMTGFTQGSGFMAMVKIDGIFLSWNLQSS